MLVSADIPDILIAKMDAFIAGQNKPSKPTWPFPTPEVCTTQMPPEDKLKLDDYLAKLAEFKAAYAALPKSRAAALRMILTQFFEAQVT